MLHFVVSDPCDQIRRLFDTVFFIDPVSEVSYLLILLDFDLKLVVFVKALTIFVQIILN